MIKKTGISLLSVLSWLCSAQSQCGVYMLDGKVTSNCSGYYTLVDKSMISLHDCKEVNNLLYKNPITIINGNCTSVLLGHLDCSSQANDLCKKTPRDVYPYVLYPILILSLCLIVPLCLVVIFLHKVGAKDSSDYWISLKGIKLNTTFSTKQFCWTQILLLALCCKSLADCVCLEPASQNADNVTFTWEFMLQEGEQACFDKGAITLVEDKSYYGLSLEYQTMSWDHYTWTAKGCGQALCGNTGDCGHWGSLGRRVEKDKRGEFYLKQCQPHVRHIFVCPNMWGCWLSTKEVTANLDKIYNVYKIGKQRVEVSTKKVGLNGCTEVVGSVDTPALHPFTLITQDQSAWLCSRTSETGYPEKGKIGDIQLLHSGEFLFDFNAFQCELKEAESSGNCRVLPPGIGTLDSFCTSLPGFVAGLEVDYLDGTLVSHSTDGQRLVVNCPSTIQVKTSPHQCYDYSATLYGLRGDPDQTIIIFKASSSQANNTWVINSNCSHHHLEIPCDGFPHQHYIEHNDLQYCEYSGIKVQDRRHDGEELEWKWDHPDHDHPIPHAEAFSFTAIVLICVGLLIIRLVCK